MCALLMQLRELLAGLTECRIGVLHQGSSRSAVSGVHLLAIMDGGAKPEPACGAKPEPAKSEVGQDDANVLNSIAAYFETVSLLIGVCFKMP